MKPFPKKTLKRTALCTVITCLVTAASMNVSATPVLLGIGSLSGSSDLSGLTGSLESGVAANVLGGMGSGLAYAGNNTFLATPDRGPNATAYAGGAAIDNTTSYISRFQTVNMLVTANVSGLPFSIAPTLTKTTLLYSTTPLNYAAGAAPAENTAGKFYFTGRSDNFSAGTSTNPDNARLDPEAIRVSNDKKTVFISDEYGPYVYQFDLATGARIKSFALPTDLAISNLSSSGDAEISGNSSGRVANKGMEGLALTPDGKTLVGIMQAPLLQDTGKTVRIVTIDIASGATHQYAYNLTTGSGVSEIVAINDHEFLIDERDGKGLGDNSNAVVKQIFRIDLAGAQDISGLSGSLSTKAVNKTLSLDVKNLLVAAGVAAQDIPAKIEGMAFGDDLIYGGVNMHTLWVANDNDFLSSIIDSKHPLGFNNSNKFYMFGYSDADLAGFSAQKFSSAVPEPSALMLLLSGLGASAVANRRRRDKK